MEATSFHFQHQLQEELASATSATKSYYNPSTVQSWISSNIHDVCDCRLATESTTCSRELGPKFGMIDSLHRTATGQDFGFHDGKRFTQQYSANDLLLARIINEEVSDNLPKLSAMISRPSRAVNESHSLLISTSEPQLPSHNFFSGRRVIGKELSPPQILCHVHKPIIAGTALSNRCNFGGVSSNSNLSTLDFPPSLASCSLGLKSQMLDPHTSYGGSCGLQLSSDAFDLNETHINLCHSNLKGRENSPSNSSNKITAFGDGVARTKRPGDSSHPKKSEAKTKKSRPSCPPLKVRKEKLGDRIQTLQKLVAPFGKTDTASVLTEAIGYIHFLHDQIQTFGVPYMKPWQSKPFRMVHLDSKEEENREYKPDLRSRGLCLLPLSDASIIQHCA